MADAKSIEVALKNIHDEESFVQELLRDSLEWEIDDDVASLDEITFAWPETDLNAWGLSDHLTDGQVKQIQPLSPSQPWGIFLLEFTREDVFTSGKGLAGPLRKVLRGLVASRKRDASLPAWEREHLLFICTFKFRHYRFAYFKAPRETSNLAPLATFGWNEGEPARTVAHYRP